MKPKTLGLLAGLTILVILGMTLFKQGSNKQPVHSDQLVFPDLMSQINDVTQVLLQSKDGKVTLSRQETGWGIEEKGGYTAALEKLKPVLIGMAELKIREPKTKNPDLYEKLGLQDYDKGGASSTLITLKTKESEVATMVLGNQRPSKGNPSQSEMYIRKPGDHQKWMVTGKLPIEKQAGEWLEKDLVNIVAKRIRQTQVTHPDGETLVVYKDTPDALDFKIQGLAEGKKVNSQFNVNNVASTVGQLELEDVKKADELEFSSKGGVKAVLETFDGLRLTLETMKKDDAVYGKMAAAFDSGLIYKEPAKESAEDKKGAKEKSEGEDEAQSKEAEKAEKDTKKPEPKKVVLKSEEDVQKEVEAINTKLNNWIYELPKARVDNFSKKKDDLIKKE